MAAKSVCLMLRNFFLRRHSACLCGRRYLSSTTGTSLPDHTSFTGRTHTCGELRTPDDGQSVVLCGWLQYNRHNMFLLLRDWQGLTQVVIPDTKKDELTDMVSRLSYETVLRVEGRVRCRPEGQENMKMDTGEIEVLADQIHVLNNCKPNLPFNIREFDKTNEALRMEFRYLDLRSSQMQSNLRLRSRFLMKMREFLCNQHGFVDVETPTLFRRTPGGAQEFVVPTRLPGKFYSLPQSPQQFKQLLMVGGIDRYFQIAKCYRDEGAKPDRQPEFTQVDVEMSFTDQDNILKLIEDMLHSCWPAEKGALPTPFPRMSYQIAMDTYGCDKPDTRFGMELRDVSDVLRQCSVPVITSSLQKEGGRVIAISLTQAAKNLSNKELEKIIMTSQEVASGVRVMTVKVRDDKSWQGGVTKSLDDEMTCSITDRLSAQPGDVIVMATGSGHNPHTVLGKVRLACADTLHDKGHPVRSPGSFNFLWVVDFPLFLPREDGQEGLESAHHPFTAPVPEDEPLVYTHPHKVRSQHYDLVLNGAEVGGGSIRIHNSNLQRYVLENVLMEDAKELEHLLSALDSGCPPHGGIALGVDRLLAIMCNANSIRDVIAFPKSHNGNDPMSKAPAEIKPSDLDLYHISIRT